MKVLSNEKATEATDETYQEVKIELQDTNKETINSKKDTSKHLNKKKRPRTSF